ncbi:MAG TPA: HEAT repeat domain-containing protein [Kofleriaceae bacterium]
MTRLRVAIALLLLGAAPARAGFDWQGAVDVDAEGLQSDDPKKRLDAIGYLGMRDIHLAQPYLIRALGDEDLSVRHQAAKALGAGGALVAVQPMIEWLADTDPKTRAVAADVLGDIGGSDAAAALTRSLGDTDSTVRQRTVKALGKIGARGNASVVIALIPRLEDDKSDVRRETIEQLEQLGDKRAVIPLVAKFSDTSRDVRKTAVRAIGKLGDKSAVPALVRLMNDPDEEVRTQAVGSLGLLGATDALDALTEQLNSGSELFKTKVAYALGQISALPGAGKPGEQAVARLVENLTHVSTRRAAVDALRVAGKAAVPALVAHLGGRLKGDPTTAVTLLGESADARATVVLTAELERGRVAMPLVLKALGATGDPNALVPVLGALSSKDGAIRLAAMEALRPLLGRDARAGDVLIEHLADEDLEVRVLAAEYLGVLQVAPATPKLTSLAGPGNPTRLRLAAIDALGSIGAVAPSPDATKALVAVLREGPTELHAAAATALSYIADPGVVPLLITQSQNDRGPTRHEIVRALGGTLRNRPDPAARKALRTLAEDANVKVAVAAIGGLAAAQQLDDAPALRILVERAAADRRRAAAWALGELHDLGSVATLSEALAVKDDRLVGDAAWALGEIAVSAPADAKVKPLVERWLYLGKHGGWAASINGVGALARTLWATPREARGDLLGGRMQGLVGLGFHKSRLVRINVAFALSAFTGDDAAVKALTKLLDDVSPHVRIAAAQGLARAATGASKDIAARIKTALDTAARKEIEPSVHAGIKAAQGGAPPLVPRDHWRTFQVFDPSADNTAVRQEPYFVHGPDGIVWASYTDARGELNSEHVAAGTDKEHVRPASREVEY